jgi:hypothetical protein
MIVFGGSQDDENGNTFDIFDLKAQRWGVLPQQNRSKGPSLLLSLHMGWIHQTYFMVFGGRADTNDFYEYQSKLFCFDLENNTWLDELPLSKGYDIPPMYPGPRSESQAICFENSMYLFGGYAEVAVGSKYFSDGYRCLHHDDNSISWSKMNPTKGCHNIWPSARAGCTLTLDATHQRAILVGGYETMINHIVYEDVWELQLQPKTHVYPKALQSEEYSRNQGIKAAKFKVTLVCAQCGREGTFGKCARCNRKAYCSHECQRKDWPKHKMECQPKNST